MFEDLRKAWDDAVQNFWRELDAQDEGDPGHEGAPRRQLAAMRRELGTADTELKRLDADLARTRGAVQSERREVETCRRRLAQAEAIGDAETARLATTFAERAAERAAVLERKAEALEAERALRVRDLTEMRAAVDAAATALGAQAGAPGVHGPAGSAGDVSDGGGGRPGGFAPDEPSSDGPAWSPGSGLSDEDRAAQDREFRRIRREAREKEAEARLQELKRKMQ
jgi:hypothetical protein